MRYPYYFGIRYHRTNLYRVNHLVQHSRIIAIFWFVVAAYLCMTDIVGIFAEGFYVIVLLGPVKFRDVDESQKKFFWFALFLNIWMAILDIRILCKAQAAISPAEIAANKLIFAPTNNNNSAFYQSPQQAPLYQPQQQYQQHYQQPHYQQPHYQQPHYQQPHYQQPQQHYQQPQSQQQPQPQPQQPQPQPQQPQQQQPQPQPQQQGNQNV
eukprot:UN00019